MVCMVIHYYDADVATYDALLFGKNYRNWYDSSVLFQKERLHLSRIYFKKRTPCVVHISLWLVFFITLVRVSVYTISSFNGFGLYLSFSFQRRRRRKIGADPRRHELASSFLAARHFSLESSRTNERCKNKTLQITIDRSCRVARTNGRCVTRTVHHADSSPARVST